MPSLNWFSVLIGILLGWFVAPRVMGVLGR